MDFLWHKVSEKEKKDIQKQAKSIMESFSKKLAKVPEIDKISAEDICVERPEGEREEGSGKKRDEEFRKIMFENAPEKNSDFIIAEKGGWEE